MGYYSQSVGAMGICKDEFTSDFNPAGVADGERCDVHHVRFKYLFAAGWRQGSSKHQLTCDSSWTCSSKTSCTEGERVRFTDYQNRIGIYCCGCERAVFFIMAHTTRTQRLPSWGGRALLEMLCLLAQRTM